MYRLLTWACVIAGLILSFIWLLAAIGAVHGISSWVPPSSVFALAVAALLSLIEGRT